MPVALLNYLDRQMLASMKFSVMRDIPDIGLEANWGTILALFKWVYAILSPVGGYLADRYSRRHVIAGSLLVWSAVTWATGQVTTYEQLLVTRALMGISEAFYIPAALALIADFHTGPTRSRAVGLHQMGIYVGVIIGGFGGYAADHPDPRMAMGVRACGIVGIVYAVPLFLLLRNPSRPRRCTTRRGRRPQRRAPRAPEQRVVHSARALLHAAGAGRLGRARLDAGDSQSGVRHRAGAGRRLGHGLLAGRGDRRRGRRRLAGRPLDARRRRAAGSYVSAIGHVR